MNWVLWGIHPQNLLQKKLSFHGLTMEPRLCTPYYRHYLGPVVKPQDDKSLIYNFCGARKKPQDDKG